MLKDAVFDLDASAQKGGTVIDSIAKLEFTNMETKMDVDGVRYFDLTNSYLERKRDTNLKDGQFYTHAYLLKWRASDTLGRTLLRHGTGSCGGVTKQSKNLGIYSTLKKRFLDSGYDIFPQEDYWDVLVATGAGDSPSSSNGGGVTTFYTLDTETGKMKERGTVEGVCSGMKYFKIGQSKQGPGKIARVMGWQRVLAKAEIEALAAPLKNST